MLASAICLPHPAGQAELLRAQGQQLRRRARGCSVRALPAPGFPAGEQERSGAAQRRVPGPEVCDLSSRLELLPAVWSWLAPRRHSVLNTRTKPARLCVCVTCVKQLKAQAINAQTLVINHSVLSSIYPTQHLKNT